MSTLFSHFSKKINHISPLEHNFTEALDTIALKPKILYFYGKLPENVAKTVAVVGSRHNTRYGEEVAYRIGYELARHGVVVISGLAYGIDSIAHRGCLDAGGCTVAVLGTPIDKIYPRSHIGLANEIIEKGGAIISEYAPRSFDYRDAPLAPGEYLSESGKRLQDAKSSFLHRNRLISGLSDAVVVVEAAERSGSLNTATHALNQGKDVFSVPGNINNPYSQGCNKLIRQGAIPFTEVDDILQVLFPDEYLKKQRKKRRKQLIGDTDVETLILQALDVGMRSGEEIMKNACLPPEVFNEAITMLEIKGRVRSLGANNWSLN
ncbi:DNA-processing protein DprA [Candidatus Saccharibacteria bacterium]|nr:DNA-processing protein DprA [Candidatus Saccharibacteria bacterium]